MKILYVIGAPGVGKTTAVEAALNLLQWPEPIEIDKPIPHLNYRNGAIQLGRHRPGGFSGTDALGMAINPKAIDYINTHPADLILGEGDRLANLKFFDAARRTATLHLVWLDARQITIRNRSLARSERLNRPAQTDAWWKSRYTKTRNLASSYPTHTINAELPPDEVAQQLATIIHTHHN